VLPSDFLFVENHFDLLVRFWIISKEVIRSRRAICSGVGIYQICGLQVAGNRFKSLIKTTVI
jgi:hypothetical protein